MWPRQRPAAICTLARRPSLEVCRKWPFVADGAVLSNRWAQVTSVDFGSKR